MALFCRIARGKRHRQWGLGTVAVTAAFAACGDEPKPTSPTEPRPAASGETEVPEAPQKPGPQVEPARCPADLSNCEEASGRIVFVERVDPDGDGDAHFVLLSREGVTAPGITIVDVRRDLRPKPLPRVGDQLAAAGPVFPGSRGQKQIEAVAISVAR